VKNKSSAEAFGLFFRSWSPVFKNQLFSNILEIRNYRRTTNPQLTKPVVVAWKCSNEIQGPIKQTKKRDPCCSDFSFSSITLGSSILFLI